MNIVLVGLNHRTAPVDVRERLSVPEGKIGAALCRLASVPGVQEGFILSTCNRVEVCAVVTETGRGLDAIRHFLAGLHPELSVDALTPSLYMHTASDAVCHLFRVASSLDSMIVGEPQILGQLKDAFEQAILHKTTGVILNKAMKKAISVAKRIRTETKIAESAVSVSFAAVELAKKIFGDLSRKSALLIGAGEMAELAARHFVSSGIEAVRVANRTFERALEMAKQFNGIPIKFEDYPVEMIKSDIVLCSAGAPRYLIRPDVVKRTVDLRRNRPIFFIDISVPRNIDPEINRLDNVFLYDIDDLQQVVDSNLRSRRKEALKGEAIIAEEIERFARWFKSLDAVPMIVALRARAETIRKVELERAAGKLGDLSPEQRRVLDALTESIVNKLLHRPLTVLKQEAHSTNGNMILEAARKLFDLEKALPPSERRGKSG